MQLYIQLYTPLAGGLEGEEQVYRRAGGRGRMGGCGYDVGQNAIQGRGNQRELFKRHTGGIWREGYGKLARWGAPLYMYGSQRRVGQCKTGAYETRKCARIPSMTPLGSASLPHSKQRGQHGQHGQHSPRDAHLGQCDTARGTGWQPGQPV